MTYAIVIRKGKYRRNGEECFVAFHNGKYLWGSSCDTYEQTVEFVRLLRKFDTNFPNTAAHIPDFLEL